MTYRETIDYLFGIRLFGQKLGLETMRELLHRLGNPLRDLKFIHIAGTNGKGSVAAMCHAVLTAAGHRTGLYTSPHLVSFCERFQVNGRLITQDDVVWLVEKLRPHLDEMQSRPPTFFEVVTALALVYFREQGVEVVVWETGLGGRLDATNVVTPLVSVITNIGLDHMQYLGDALTDIAREKCGIIKPGVPVVTATDNAEALAIIRRTCAEHKCSLTVVRPPWPEYEIPLVGDHQRINCATAMATLRASGLPVTELQLREGLRNTRWPGRFQVIGNVVLDGAHNPHAAEVLAATLGQRFAGKQVLLILGVLKDKDYGQVCRILGPLSARVICVPVRSERTCDPRELAKHFPAPIICQDVTAALALRQPDEVAVVTGSLFLVGEALQALQPATVSEREMALQ